MAGRPPTKTVWVRGLHTYNSGKYGSVAAGQEKEIFQVFYDWVEKKYGNNMPFELIDRPAEPPELGGDEEVAASGEDQAGDTASDGDPECMSTMSSKSMRSPEDK